MAFSFKEITASSMGIGVTNVRRPALPEVSNVMQEVPGYAGTVFMRNDLRPRMVEIDVYFLGTSIADAMTDTHTLAQWLYSTTPELLEFDDEPGRIYYAILDGSTDLEAIGEFRRGTLRFVCPDPFVYASTETSTNITEGANEVTNDGGMYAFPVIEVTLDADSTFVEVSNPDTGEYVLVGQDPVASGTPSTPQNAWTPVLSENGADISDWTESTLKPLWGSFANATVNDSNHGDNPMSMDTDGVGGFSTEYGSADGVGEGAGWHGPTIKRNITGDPLNDFAIQAKVQLSSFQVFAQMGCINILLINAGGEVFGQIGIGDATTTADRSIFSAYAGGAGVTPHEFMNGYDPANINRWINLYNSTYTQGAVLNLTRMRNAADPSGPFVWHVDLTTMYDVYMAQWTDVDGIAEDELVAIGVNMMGYSTAAVPTYFELSDVSVKDITIPEGDQYYFAGTDVVTFDHRQGVVLLDQLGSGNPSPYSRIPDDYNGGYIPMNALVHLGSSFFALPTGGSTVNIYADTGVNVSGTLALTKRWL